MQTDITTTAPADDGTAELASVVNLARLQIDAALPTIRTAAGALGNTDEARGTWMAAYLLESLCDRLRAAEGA